MKSRKSRRLSKLLKKKFYGGAICSPTRKASGGTCYKDSELMHIRNVWNNYSSDKITATTTREIWKQLHDKMKNVCKDENCWAEQPFLHNTDLKSSFAPKHPKSWNSNPNEWLSSVDILSVMKQYEKAYKCFKFLGPYPIDFDGEKGKCVEREMCDFQLKKYIDKGYKKIGFVFNTDPHYKSGEHWISLFINLKTQEIFFFDSAGDKVPSEIKAFVDRIIQQGSQLSLNIHFDQNEKTHQHTSTECGMYALYFIINMLKDTTNSKKIKTTRIPDKDVFRMRKRYFNQA
uniref:Ubiquitin-like protease family profile domain-containing protein n=1 Tax=viral metagenome TaxID=1070528 RepID=A0A6C0HQZ4_9ZZZZ